MSRLTGHNRSELKVLRYFMPSFLAKLEVTETDAKLYFDWSDRGIGKQEVESRIARESQTREYTGLSALYFAKRNRDLQITSYLEDWGQTCNVMDFVGEPKEMVEFIAKAMNKPGIMDMWMLHNDPEHLTDEQKIRLVDTMGFLIK